MNERYPKYDALIVGGGMAGLTAAAYLAKGGAQVLLCEKEKRFGGLVNSFERNGFSFDAGIRAMENSGVVFPMVRQLGLDIDFLPNHITLGIEDRVMQVESEQSVADYQELLGHFYPDSVKEIEEIITAIRRIMRYMDVQYGIDNPLFLDFKKDREYMLKAVLPWMVQYALTAPKIGALSLPVEQYLSGFTRNQALLDIIMQHFFHQTPAFFALSYLKLFLEYYYPRGGTGTFPRKLVEFIQLHGGHLRPETEIVRVNPFTSSVEDHQGNRYEYGRLIWAADQKAFYRMLDTDQLDEKVRKDVNERQALLADKTGNDSVLTLYLAVDLSREYFKGIASEHFFYTPYRTGLSQAGPAPLDQGWPAIQAWLKEFLRLTTYEISIPVLRDESLAPPGKTGLIISTLFDYQVTRAIQDMGRYADFTALVESFIPEILAATIYPEIQGRILDRFTSSPLTIARLAGTTDGAITGWAFSNHPLPAESRIPKILNAIRTPVPGIYQAGQWTYSPSGFPISLLTGKLAADQVIKDLPRKRR